MHENEKWKWSCSIVSDSLQPHGLQPTRLLCPWDFPAKITGVGCHRLFHQWTWVWVNSRSWWWTGRPGILQFMGSQRVGHDWATELNWTYLFCLQTIRSPPEYKFHESRSCDCLIYQCRNSLLEKEMATHSSVLAWRIPGTGEPGGLPSMGSHRVGHDWSDLAAAASGT